MARSGVGGWGPEDCGNTHDGKEGTRNRAGGSPGVQPGPSGVAHESGNAKAKPANESEDHETAEKFSTHRAGQEEDEWLLHLVSSGDRSLDVRRRACTSG